MFIVSGCKALFEDQIPQNIILTLHCILTPQSPAVKGLVPIRTFLCWLEFMINLQVHSALSLTFSGGWKNCEKFSCNIAAVVLMVLRPYHGGPGLKSLHRWLIRSRNQISYLVLENTNYLDHFVMSLGIFTRPKKGGVQVDVLMYLE